MPQYYPILSAQTHFLYRGPFSADRWLGTTSGTWLFLLRSTMYMGPHGVRERVGYIRIFVYSVIAATPEIFAAVPNMFEILIQTVSTARRLPSDVVEKRETH